MPSKKRRQPKQIVNRRARYDYTIGDTYIVGMELSGAETKSLRLGLGSLVGAYVIIKDNQLWLINATISGTGSIRISDQDQTRTRRLLAKRREIDQIIQTKQQGRTVVPLEILNRGRYIKLKIAVAQGKKRYDKRQIIKKRSEERQMANAIKSRRN